MLNIATKYNYSIVSNIMDANAVDQLRQDRSYVEKIFSNSNFDDLVIIEIIKDIYDYSFNLRSEIVSNMEEYLPDNVISISKDGSLVKRKCNNTYKIPKTNCIVYSAYYGFVIDKNNISLFDNFINAIKIKEKPILDESNLNSVIWNEKTESMRKDVLFFSRSKNWFTLRDLPYARSYLLYGPPGNGKTSVIRAISKYYNRPVESFSFSGKYEDPDNEFSRWMLGDLETRKPPYSYAVPEIPISFEESAPPRIDKNITTAKNIRILLLEDIDRYFSKEESFKTQVSLSAILNCLDGVTQRTNSILIATANDPKKLDPEVLLRPGRFDMRIPFDCPTEDTISEYLIKLCNNDSVTEDCTKKVAKMVIGHSMAFVKGIFLNAANKAFSKSNYAEDISLIRDDDIMESANEMLSNLGKQVKANKAGVGYY